MIWGFLIFQSYGHDLPERCFAPVDAFLELIAARVYEPWLYSQTQFFAQFLGSDNCPSLALALDPGASYPPDPPLLPYYLAALLGAIRKQNAMHGLRELEATADYGWRYYGSYRQREGQSSSGIVPFAGPIFVADDALPAGSMILEIDALGPDMYPIGERAPVLHFLRGLLDQLNSLPPQDPFMGKEAEEGDYSYSLVRQLEPRPWVHPHFSNAMAAHVTATLIAYLAGLEQLYYVHFKVLQVRDRWPSFVATGVVAIIGNSSSSNSSAAGAIDIV